MKFLRLNAIVTMVHVATTVTQQPKLKAPKTKSVFTPLIAEAKSVPVSPGPNSKMPPPPQQMQQQPQQPGQPGQESQPTILWQCNL
jgi:hypothetical protein